MKISGHTDTMLHKQNLTLCSQRKRKGKVSVLLTSKEIILWQEIICRKRGNPMLTWLPVAINFFLSSSPD